MAQSVTLPGTDCILMYHGTPRSEAAALDRQLGAIGLFFDVVPLAALAEPRRHKRLRRRIALTFDDGLKSNVEVAYPLLAKHGLCATFFVCPGLLGQGNWLWNHEARQRLLSLPQDAREALAAAVGAPAEVEAFVDWMKTLKIAERRRVEDEVRAATPGFRPSRAEHDEFDLAEWEDLKALNPDVVTVGSHSMSHPILTSLEPNEIEAEVGHSRIALEKGLGRPVGEFCYPNGELDPVTLAAARRHYRAAVTAERGSLRGDVDPHRLPRYAADPRASLRLARRLTLG